MSRQSLQKPPPPDATGRRSLPPTGKTTRPGAAGGPGKPNMPPRRIWLWFPRLGGRMEASVGNLEASEGVGERRIQFGSIRDGILWCVRLQNHRVGRSATPSHPDYARPASSWRNLKKFSTNTLTSARSRKCSECLPFLVRPNAYAPRSETCRRA